MCEGVPRLRIHGPHLRADFGLVHSFRPFGQPPTAFGRLLTDVRPPPPPRFSRARFFLLWGGERVGDVFDGETVFLGGPGEGFGWVGVGVGEGRGGCLATSIVLPGCRSSAATPSSPAHASACPSLGYEEGPPLQRHLTPFLSECQGPPQPPAPAASGPVARERHHTTTDRAPRHRKCTARLWRAEVDSAGTRMKGGRRPRPRRASGARPRRNGRTASGRRDGRRPQSPGPRHPPDTSARPSHARP